MADIRGRASVPICIHGGMCSYIHEGVAGWVTSMDTPIPNHACACDEMDIYSVHSV